ncbi:MAG: lipid II flippase MurJ [Minisyncoccia bacterium]
MVGRSILLRLSKPVRGLHEAAYVLAALTLASQVLALLRDRIFAHEFGAGVLLDVYYAAFKIPDLVFALVASLVSAYVLIPRIAGASKEEARKLISETTSFLLLVGGILSVVLAVFAPIFLALLFPTFMESVHADAFVSLTRLLLVQPILLGLSSIATSVTQVQRRFFLFALSPVLYNLGIILGAIFLYPHFGLVGIGIGVASGAFLHLAIQIPTLAKASLFPKLLWPHMRSMWSVMKDSLPRSLALGVGSLATLFLTALAAKTGSGSVSVFALASNLGAVPLSLIGASYATAAFPALAEHAGRKDENGFAAILSTAGRHLIFWSAVISVLTIVLRAHIVRVVLGSGAFDWDATRLTAAVLAILIISLIAQGLVLLASRAFYAAHRSWNPFFIQCFGLFISVTVGWGTLHFANVIPTFRFFIEALLRVGDVPGTEVLFIAFGAMLGQLGMGILALLTLKTVAPGVAKGFMRPFFEGLGAAIVGGAAAYGTLFTLGNIASLSTLGAVFTEGLVAGIVGLAASALILVLLENREFRDLYKSLLKIKTRMLPPQSEF